MPAAAQNKSEAEKEKLQKTLARMNITSNNEAIMKSLADKAASKGYNLSKFTDEQLARLCEQEAKQMMTMKIGRANFSTGQAKKIPSTGEIAVYKNGNLVGKYSSEQAYYSMISKQLKEQTAPLMTNLIQVKVQKIKTMTAIKSEEKKANDAREKQKAAAKQITNIRKDLNDAAKSFTKLQSAALQAKRDLAQQVNDFENRKLKLEEMAILQGTRNDRRMEQIQNARLQRAKMEQDRLLHQQHMANLEKIHREQLQNDNNIANVTLLQQQQLAKLQLDQLAKMQAENMKTANALNNNMIKGFSDIAGGIGNMNTNLVKGFNDLGGQIGNLGNDISNGFKDIDLKLDKILKILDDIDNDKNMDKILDQYTEPCPAGYCWMRTNEPGTYRCSAGSHVVTAAQLKQAAQQGRVITPAECIFSSNAQIIDRTCVGRGRW
jgi:hypothetical protein